MYGFTPKEAVGRNSFDLLRTEFTEPLPELREKLLRYGHWSGELSHMSRGGARIMCLSRWVAEQNAKGDILRVLESNNDITDRVRVQAEIRRANQDLEQFAFSASHDLQEPLRSIKIYSELLGRESRDTLSPDALKYLDFLRSGAARMEILVRDLLAYTQAGQLEEAAKPIDAGEALKVALAALSGAMVEAKARVIAGTLPMVRVHPTHLQQLFQNIVGNAIKYRDPKRVPEIYIDAKFQKQQWVFAVRDNGIGIEPEFKESIFGLFKRLHTSDEYSGTGIGLAICQRIVDRYHGRIWVESGPAKGSTFFFSLPV
jgi:light-regulated signal transduction histidine kinase (bacteriophytochrome)